jgi:hypothetical protein
MIRVQDKKTLRESTPDNSVAHLQEELIAVKLREAEANLSLKDLRQRVGELSQHWQRHLQVSTYTNLKVIGVGLFKFLNAGLPIVIRKLSTKSKQSTRLFIITNTYRFQSSTLVYCTVPVTVCSECVNTTEVTTIYSINAICFYIKLLHVSTLKCHQKARISERSMVNISSFHFCERNMFLRFICYNDGIVLNPCGKSLECDNIEI